MSKRGRLEARWTFASNQQLSWTDSAGTATATVAAGSYYPTDYCSTLQAAIQALAGNIGNFASVTLSRGESGATGRVTITSSSQTPYAVTWTTTDHRDALGFTGNIASTSSASVGTNHAKGVWLPDCPKWSRHGNGASGNPPLGSLVTDATMTIGPAGTVHTIKTAEHRQTRQVHWQAVSAARCLAHHESVTGESWEAFFRDCMGRVSSYIPVGPYVRLIWDADVDGTYTTGKLLWPSTFDVEQFAQNWVGRYTVHLPTLIVES